VERALYCAYAFVFPTNKKFMENHPYTDIPEQIYPLYQFRMKEWEIIK